MTEIRACKYLTIAFLFVITATSCSKSPDAPAVSASDNGLLQYVPADTPYLVASLTPLPEDVLDKMEPKLDAMIRGYTSVIRAVIKEKVGAAGEGEAAAGDAALAKMDAISNEISTLLTIDGMRAAGIGRKSTSVIYGDGLLPVLRLRLTDSALMEQAIARIEAKAGSKMSVEKIGDQSYRYAGDEQARVILALIDDDLVVSLVPAGHSDELLKSVLGLTLPVKSMTDSGELGELAAQNGFQSYFLMLVDITRIAATFLDDQTATNQELLGFMDYDAAALSDVCKAEIRELAGIAPRLIGGYTEVTTERWSSKFVIELRQDIATGLAKLVAPVQGLGITQGGLFSLGMSLDLLAARDFYSARLDEMQADPFECEDFAGLQAGVEQGREALKQPLPPIVYTVKGVLAVVDALEGMDLASQQPPTLVDASILLAIDNPQGLLAMGSAFSPELAALNLQADGKPVKLDLQPISPAVSEAYVAMTDNALAVSVGQNAADKLTDLLNAEFAEPAPFMSMNMDGGRYYSFIAEAMQLAQGADSGKASPELVSAMSDLMASMADWFGRISFAVNFTERGVEMPSSMELLEEE